MRKKCWVPEVTRAFGEARTSCPAPLLPLDCHALLACAASGGSSELRHMGSTCTDKAFLQCGFSSGRASGPSELLDKSNEGMHKAFPPCESERGN